MLSSNGLLTTVCYRLGDQPPVYALEGSIAVTGSLVQWLRDNLGLIQHARRDRGAGAFGRRQRRRVLRSGVLRAVRAALAPGRARRHRSASPGSSTAGHLARAALEATAFQTREVVEAMNADSGVALTALKVDGGMAANELLMQFQADLLDVPVVRPRVAETTALGAAYAAGLAVGFWTSTDEIRANWAADKTWQPAMQASHATTCTASGRRL